MAAVAPAIGLVSTVASISSRNAQIRAQNYAITKQQEANERAAQIRQMGFELQTEQLRQQTEMEKLTAEAQFQQANASYNLEELTRRSEIAQQLAAIDLQLAEQTIAQITEQYQQAQQAFEQTTQLQQQRTAELNQAAGELSGIDQLNKELLKAARTGDMQLAEQLSRQIGAYGSTAATESQMRQQDYEILRSAYEAQGYQAQLQEQLVANDQYYQFLNRAIQDQMVRNQEAARLRGAASQQAGQQTAASMREYSTASGNVENMARALLPTIRDANINQANINQGYSQSALRNAALESRYQTASANAQLEASRPRGSILGDLALVAQASIPLFQRLQFNQSRVTQPPVQTTALNFDATNKFSNIIG